MRKRKVEKMINVVAEGHIFGCDVFVPESKVQKFLQWVMKKNDELKIHGDKMVFLLKGDEKLLYRDNLIAHSLKVTIKKDIDMTSLFEVATLELPNGFKLQVEQKVQFFWEDQYRLGFIEKIAPNFGECGWVKIKDYDWISNQVQIEKGVWKVGEVIKGNAKPVAPPTDNIEGF